MVLPLGLLVVLAMLGGVRGWRCPVEVSKDGWLGHR